MFAASMAGCVWLIVVAERYADLPLPDTGLKVLTMPLTRASQPTMAPPLQPGKPASSP